MNRRNWLKISGLTGAAALLSQQTLAAALPVSPTPMGEKAQMIYLNANENPYGPSEKVRKALTQAFDQICRYPFRAFSELKQALAQKHGLSPENVVLTAGSMEGLRAAGLAYGIHGGEIVAADPVFDALPAYAEHVGAYIHRVPLDANMGHDLAAMEQRITLATSLVFICNPNNPTGSLLPARELEDFCRTVSDRTMVFADEAYMDYVQDPDYPSMIPLVQKGENVIVSRTFSKVYGLAGIRVGYLLARPDIAQRLQPYVMAAPNILGIAAALEAMKDPDFYTFSLNKAAQGKEQIYQTLQDKKLSYVPSHGNFVFFKTGLPIAEVQQRYRDQGIGVGRPFPPYTDWCRISTGRLEDVALFCEATKRIF